jgi:hypothetical protein
MRDILWRALLLSNGCRQILQLVSEVSLLKNSEDYNSISVVLVVRTSKSLRGPPRCSIRSVLIREYDSEYMPERKTKVKRPR